MNTNITKPNEGLASTKTIETLIFTTISIYAFGGMGYNH